MVQLKVCSLKRFQKQKKVSRKTGFQKPIRTSSNPETDNSCIAQNLVDTF